MNIEDFKTAINKEKDHLDFTITNFSIEDNVFKIRTSHAHHSYDWETPNELQIKQFDLYATFYGQNFEFTLLRKNIESNTNDFSYIEALDANKLIESFSDAIEDDYWEYIKAFCLRWEELEKIEYKE